VQSILHFASSEALDIDGLGEALATQLVERDLVESLADLYEMRKDDLTALERMGETSADNLLRELERTTEEATLPRLVYGLGIPHVGSTLSGELARVFRSLDGLLDAEREDLLELEDVGGTVAGAILQWTGNPKNRSLVTDLKRHGLDPKAARAGDRLEGETYVITGELESMTRDEAKEAVRRQGGRATGSVSGETDALVVGSTPGETKRKDAEAKGVPTIDEAEFLKRLGED
jgi:DNA ligase (NAD+)